VTDTIKAGWPTDWRTACEKTLAEFGRWVPKDFTDITDDPWAVDDALDPDNPPDTFVKIGVIAYWKLRYSLGAMPPEYALTYSTEAFKANLVDLWCSKQNDYGHGNILKFGSHGIVVRMSDKIERLKNLEAKGASPANESVMDSWRDLLGYAVIGIMLEMGTYTLPLLDVDHPTSKPTNPLTGPRHDPVYAASNRTPTTAGTHIYPDGWRR
jgi:hypothetical protein